MRRPPELKKWLDNQEVQDWANKVQNIKDDSSIQDQINKIKLSKPLTKCITKYKRKITLKCFRFSKI